MNRITTIAIIALTVITGILRFFITPRLNLPTIEGCYESFAHLFVGGLFGYWLATKERLYLYLFLVVSLLELVMFIIQKHNAG